MFGAFLWFIFIASAVLTVGCQLYSFGDAIYQYLSYHTSYCTFVKQHPLITSIPVIRELVLSLYAWWYQPSVTVLYAFLSLLFYPVSFTITFCIVRYVVLTARDPGMWTHTTVSLVHQTSLADARGDPVQDVFQVVIGPPRPLEPIVFSNISMEPQATRHALGVLLALRDDPGTAARATSTLLRRYDYSVATTVGSVRQAREMANRIRATLAEVPGNEVSGQSSTGTGAVTPTQLSVLQRIRCRTWVVMFEWCLRLIPVVSAMYALYQYGVLTLWEFPTRNVLW
jgi:hypothetical protein